jgi:hypothetical protein
LRFEHAHEVFNLSATRAQPTPSCTRPCGGQPVTAGLAAARYQSFAPARLCRPPAEPDGQRDSPRTTERDGRASAPGRRTGPGRKTHFDEAPESWGGWWRVRFGLLGPLMLADEGGAAVSVDWARLRELLAALLQANMPVSVDAVGGGGLGRHASVRR